MHQIEIKYTGTDSVTSSSVLGDGKIIKLNFSYKDEEREIWITPTYLYGKFQTDIKQFTI